PNTQGRAQFYSVIKKRQEVSTKIERQRSRVPGIIRYICTPYGVLLECLLRTDHNSSPRSSSYSSSSTLLAPSTISMSLSWI
ncbi:hypothetical protein N7457_003987, partial [Penicillium paradoxum]|uniref:uncharacterized protein n=1 Tax=Penicillium paradoxum TaxID=176176 RepID=UPI00254976AB